jgi:hypothetical protein
LVANSNMIVELKSVKKKLVRKEANARFKEHHDRFGDQNENNRRLLEMIKDIKEEVDVDRVIRGHNDKMASPAHATRLEKV